MKKFGIKSFGNSSDNFPDTKEAIARVAKNNPKNSA